MSGIGYLRELKVSLVAALQAPDRFRPAQYRADKLARNFSWPRKKTMSQDYQATVWYLREGNTCLFMNLGDCITK